jgi:hypothetical protein
MRKFIRGLALLAAAGSCLGQKLPEPTRLWSVGPLAKGEPVTGVTFGSSGATFSGPHVDSQTRSIFSATRSVVFAGDRIVLASDLGPVGPQDVDEILSLDIRTGEIKDSRKLVGFGLRGIFATSDGNVIASGSGELLQLTADLKDAGTFEASASGHRFLNAQNMSPDGSTLGNRAWPEFQLIDGVKLQVTKPFSDGLVDTSVSGNGVITDNVHWIRDYPKDLSFVTYYDAAGDHLLYHGKCGGRPQFLTNELILEPGCKSPLIIDIQGKLVTTIALKDAFSYAGVSQNGKRFALQVASFSGMHSIKHEKFVIYSLDTGEPITEVTPDELADEQSWTAFSPDGSMFVVGSPLKLTLYRLP